MSQPNQPQSEKVQQVAQIFSLTRDIEAQNQYVEDGDTEMYSEANITLRKQLRLNEAVNRQIQNFLSLYRFEAKDQCVTEGEYKRIQRVIAEVLRPEISKEELQFVVDRDWEHDSNGEGLLSGQRLADGLYELVDVWTIGASAEEYVAFIKLLKKKVERFQAKK